MGDGLQSFTPLQLQSLPSGHLGNVSLNSVHGEGLVGRFRRTMSEIKVAIDRELVLEILPTGNFTI